ncbi:unnamed protein product, partial [Scytosiphon promiscuus]
VTPPNVKERLVDSQLYEQIPFQTALDDGCTHVLVLRSRPDDGWQPARQAEDCGAPGRPPILQAKE